MKTSSVRSAILLAGLIGLLVSLFATAEFLQTSLRSFCSISSFFSCSLVDQSGKTTTLGIPDYLWGIGGFVLILVVAGVAERRPEDTRPAYLLLAITTAGVAVSLYFLYVELVEIDAMCVVCLAAYIFGFLAWGGAISLVGKLRTPQPPSDEGASETTES